MHSGRSDGAYDDQTTAAMPTNAIQSSAADGERAYEQYVVRRERIGVSGFSRQYGWMSRDSMQLSGRLTARNTTNRVNHRTMFISQRCCVNYDPLAA